MKQQEEQILAWIQENPMITQQELAQRAGITRSTVAVHISNLTKRGLIAGRGYIVRSAPYAVVIGGANMDIGGTSYAPLVRRDSNPGCVQMSLGGVGRNIAHNMALLGMDVRMITALGNDLYAQRISNSCAQLGIDLSASLTVPSGRTSTYLFIADPDGEMELGLSDMEIYEQLTVPFLAGKETLLNHARVVVVDTNIPAESIMWLAQNCKAPIFLDPVSTAKAVKAAPVLGKLHTLKPNRLEAEILSGVKITDAKSLEACAQKLLQTGLSRVFISLGGDGVYAADRTGYAQQIPCLPAQMVNTTGCGDAFMAALAWGFLKNLDPADCARAGLAASAIAMEGAQTINPGLCEEAVLERAGLVLEEV